MATTVRVSVNATKTLAFLTRTKQNLALRALDAELKKEAVATQRFARSITPKGPLAGKGHGGRTRDMWVTHRSGPSRYSVRNRSRIYRWLDNGTKSHGAKKSGGAFKGRMFVPISSRAKRLGIRGVMGNRKAFRYGKDFILAERVRGIKPHRITEKVAAKANAAVSIRVNRYIKTIINK